MGQGPAIPIDEQKTTQKVMYQNDWLRNSGALQSPEYISEAGESPNCVSTPAGMKRSPPRKGGQYAQCTEYVKHKVKMTGYQHDKSKQDIATRLPFK